MSAPVVPVVEALLTRRAASLFYEALLLAAVLWCAMLPLTALQSYLHFGPHRAFYQLYLTVVAGIYFTLQWTRGGQTLAMKTWHLKLVARDGSAITGRQAVFRYVAALIGAAFFGAGFLWALVDRNRSFLHDRLAATRIVRTC
ncbi:MAG TPA: RDD family protein [Burkholderiales bacterium]|nr:RDD family protein [Burkholderiales bacterium]